MSRRIRPSPISVRSLGRDRMRPGAVQHVRIDFIFVTVGIDIAPREERLQEAGTVSRRVLIEVIDEGILRPAQQSQGRGMAEILRISPPAMGESTTSGTGRARQERNGPERRGGSGPF